MIPSVVNSKNVHSAIVATVDPYDTPSYNGSNRGAFELPTVPLKNGLNSTLKKFGIPEVIGMLDKVPRNNYYRCSLLCGDGSVLEDDLSIEEVKAIPEIRKTSATSEWLGGGYPVEPIIEEAWFKSDNKDNLATCILCGRTLTHPRSVKRLIGPECIKRVIPSGSTFVQGDEVTGELIDASKVYSNEKFQRWVIKAVLTLGSPLPIDILEWLGNQFFGYSNKPSLYYLDAEKTLNCIEVRNKKLIHRQITSLSTCKNDLDYRAWRIVRLGDADNLVVVPYVNHSPLIQGQWVVMDGRRRSGVCRERGGNVWCTCGEENCNHVKAVRMFEKEGRRAK